MRTARRMSVFVLVSVIVGSQRVVAETVKFSFNPPLDHAIQSTTEVRTTVFDNETGGSPLITDLDRLVTEVTLTKKITQLFATVHRVSHEKLINGQKVDLSASPMATTALIYVLDDKGMADNVSGVEVLHSKLQLQLISANADPKLGEVAGFMSLDRLSELLKASWNAGMLPTLALAGQTLPLDIPIDLTSPLPTRLPRMDLPPSAVEGIPLTIQYRVSRAGVKGGSPGGYEWHCHYTGTTSLTDVEGQFINGMIWTLAPDVRGPWGKAKTGFTVTVTGDASAQLDEKTLVIRASTVRQQLIVKGAEGSYRLERETQLKAD